MLEFIKPTSEQQFWLAPHCGPGHADATLCCGFCGLPHSECASRDSDAIAAGKGWLCGGSGFWCRSCGRFWAQDVCGESDNTKFRNTNALLSLKEDEGYVFCYCGNRLFPVVPE